MCADSVLCCVCCALTSSGRTQVVVVHCVQVISLKRQRRNGLGGGSRPCRSSSSIALDVENREVSSELKHLR